MTARSWHAQIPVAPRKRRTLKGVLFASRGEMTRWAELQMLEKAGVIRDLKRQVRHELRLPDGTPVVVGRKTPRCAVYTPDFEYTEGGRKIVEEYKGCDNGESRLRRAVFTALTGQVVRVTGPAAMAG